MDKNDFDIDFDFEKEYGFDPEEFLNSENPGDFDLSQIDDLDLDISEEPTENAGETKDDDFDFDLDEEDTDARQEDYDEDFTAGIDFSNRKPVEDLNYLQEEGEDDQQPVGDEQEEAYEEPDHEADAPDFPEEEDDPPVREKKKRSIPLPRLPKLPKRPKSDKPSIFSRFFDLYFGPLVGKSLPEQEVNVGDGRRRRRKPSRMQILKEVYLPPVILCIALVLVLSFAVGSISNTVKLKKINDEKKKQEQQNAQIAADAAEQEFKAALKEAEDLAIGYDYEGAIQRLESIETDDTARQQEITAKKAEYVNTQNSMKKWEDPNSIANLSFHVLIADTDRAFSSKDLKGQYNRNFVTIGEFSKILDQLYAGGYVLVDFDSFVDSNVGLDGNKSFFLKTILLPEGKKPIMITETMVNYFAYMVDGNKDGEPDASGDGFANKLVITDSGDIKAQYVGKDGQTQIGNYDLVPILEDFIKAHPDFSYQGARATLAVTGSEGVFGYRTNTSYIGTKGQEYYEQEVAGAKKLVEALREKGYTIACFTYNNEAYRNLSVAQIKADIQNWTNQIVPVIGDVEIMVFARTSDIDDYSGNKFSVLYDAGFRYFVNNGTAPKAEVNNSYVRQTRLMVTGNAMGWSSSQFANYFDCNAVLDMASRGSIPN